MTAAEDVLTQAKAAQAALPADATQAQKDAAQAAVDAAQAAVNKAGNQVATAQNVADAINKSGFTLTAQGANGSIVNPGETVDLVILMVTSILPNLQKTMMWCTTYHQM